jgi:catechol 2,3-dioxygenase
LTFALRGLELRVRDLELEVDFYQRLLGCELQTRGPREALLTPPGGLFQLRLSADPQAPLRPQPSLGLYHFALLLPDRASLAALAWRLLSYPAWQGASDHGVSQALYLADPEGNGIELAWDRPPELWPRWRGELAMTTEPLDLAQLLTQADREAGLPPGTRLGHLHLHVADLDEAERFYTSLGLQVTQRSYPGARFLAADGYHHHIGINLWAHGRRAPEGATGLTAYWIALSQPRGELRDPLGLRVVTEPL